METPPAALANQVRDHLCSHILPFWREYSVDHKMGGYIIHLERDGQRSGKMEKSLALQARMVDAFALGASFSGDPGYLECARSGFRFITNSMFAFEENRWISVVERNGAPIEDRIRAHDLTALILGFASLTGAGGENKPLEQALMAQEELDLFFWDQKSDGYFDSLSSQWEVDRTIKSLDVHLHAIEAMYALYDATEDMSFLGAAERVSKLIRSKMRYGEKGPLIEQFTHDWRTDAEDMEPAINYGHLFKAAHLALGGYLRTQHPAYLEFARETLEFALQTGVDPAAGAYSTASVAGEVTDPNHSWWVQCEALAALARAWRLTQEDSYGSTLERLLDYCLTCFHDRQFGEWYTELNTLNDVVDARKGNDAKCAYPIVRALISVHDDLTAPAE